MPDGSPSVYIVAAAGLEPASVPCASPQGFNRSIHLSYTASVLYADPAPPPSSSHAMIIGVILFLAVHPQG